MSQKKKPWWAFWKKDEPHATQEASQAKPTDMGNKETTPLQAAVSPASSRRRERTDPNRTFDLHIDEISDEISDDTIDGIPDGAVEAHQARIQAARERAARHKGRFGVGVPSSDALPAVGEAVEEETPQNEAPPVKESPSSALFLGTIGVMTALLSLPFWLYKVPPLTNLFGHYGLLAALQNRFASIQLEPGYQFVPASYVGSGGDYLLALMGAVFPINALTPLLLQIYLITSLLAMLALLLFAQRPLWNATLGLLLLFHSSFFQGDLGFLLATPVLIFGIACLVAWMTQKESWAAVASIALAFVLLVLDGTAYILFLMATACTASITSKRGNQWVIRVALVFSSLILYLPWVLVLLGVAPQVYAGDPTAPLFSWSSWPSKLEQLSSLIGFYGHISDPQARALLVLGLGMLGFGGVVAFVGQAPAKDEAAPHRALFPLLGFVALLLYLLAPTHWHGKALHSTGFLSFAALMLIGWVHIDPKPWTGKLLLTGVLCLGLASTVMLLQEWNAFNKESQPLRAAIEQVPGKGRLILWRAVPKGGHPALSQMGGWYMLKKKGSLAAIQMRGHLVWRIVGMPKKPKTTQTKQKQLLAPLKGWDYLLTRWRPSAKQRPYLRKLKEVGPYRIYRIQLP